MALTPVHSISLSLRLLSPPSLAVISLSYSNVCSLRLNLSPSSSPPHIPLSPSSSVPFHFFICFLHYLFHLLITPLQFSFLLPIPSSFSLCLTWSVCVCVCVCCICMRDVTKCCPQRKHSQAFRKLSPRDVRREEGRKKNGRGKQGNRKGCSEDSENQETEEEKMLYFITEDRLSMFLLARINKCQSLRLK